MPRYIVERRVPSADRLTDGELAQMARTSVAAADSLGVPFTWLTSYVAGDKIYDLHEAEDEDCVVEQLRRGGFSADLVVQVTRELGPADAAT